MSTIFQQQDYDELYAYKAISLMTALSGAEKSVASDLVSHCNRRTKQCNPSASRLAKILKMNRVTVTKAAKN